MRNVFWGAALILFGVLLLLDNLDVADFGEMVSQYWPFLIILWGLSIIVKHNRSRTSSPETPPPFATGEQFSGDLLHDSNVFGNIMLSVTSKNFKGGSISTIFGDCNLDLTEAVVAEGDHILRVHSVFGNSLISLPQSSPVSISATAVMGNLSVRGLHKGGLSSAIDSTPPEYTAAPNRLKMLVSKVFGNVRIF